MICTSGPIPQASNAVQVPLLSGLLCLVSIVTAVPAAAAAADNWKIGGSITHSSGDYGSGANTSVTYAPITIRRYFDSGDIALIVSYVSITGNCDVTLLSGTPNRTGGTCPTRTITTRNGREITRTQQARTTESGLGDTIVRGRYYILDGNQVVPTIALIGRVKIPTADSAKGLGTGRFDETFGMELTQRLPSNFMLFADAGYTFIGHVQGAGFRNQWYYNLGVGYYFSKSLMGSLYYEEWRSVVQGFQNPQILLGALNWSATNAISLTSALQVGLSDGAPNYGLTVGAYVRF